MNRRITEIAEDFQVGNWKAEATKNENYSCLTFGFGNDFHPNNMYQDDEVTDLMAMMDQVKEFLDSPIALGNNNAPTEELKPIALPPAPITMEELIQIINEGKIKSITCETEFEGPVFNFGFFIVTENNRSFYFGQEFDLKSGLNNMEVIDFTSGNGRYLPFNLGKGFDPKNRTDLNIRPDWENADMGW